MSARSTIIVSACAIGVAALVGCAAASTGTAPAPVEAPAAQPAQWSYDGESGPGHWAELDADFRTCAAGADQSPIDLPATIPERSTSIRLSAENTEGDVFDSGHAVEIESDGEGDTLTYAGTEFTLQQAHAHVPSEHTVNGQPAAAELHLVHADATGHLLVLGVLVTEGEASAALAPFIDAAVHPDDDGDVTIDVADLLPSTLENYEYSGSLTTPPCTEDVQWVVLGTPISMSAEQIDILESVHSHNARPTQPLGDRVVVGGTAELATEG
jgi:carbonic anhydrase